MTGALTLGVLAPAGPAAAASPQPAGTHSLAAVPAQGGPVSATDTGDGAGGPAGYRAAAAAAPACDIAPFATTSGDPLVTLIKNTPVDCLNNLFYNLGSSTKRKNTFTDAKLTKAADALKLELDSYNGLAESATDRLATYLRAAEYNAYYYKTDVNLTLWTTATPFKDTLKSSINTFFANSHTQQLSDGNGRAIATFFSMANDISDTPARLGDARRYLSQATSAFQDSLNKAKAIRGSLSVIQEVWDSLSSADRATVFNSASENPTLIQQVDTFLTSTLPSVNTDLDNDDIFATASRLLANGLKEPALRSVVRPKVVALLNRTSLTANTAPVWLRLQWDAITNDSSNCSAYAACSTSALRTMVKDHLGLTSYACPGGGITVYSKMSAENRTATCQSVAGQNAYFADLTGVSTPLPGGDDQPIEIYVASSRQVYKTYFQYAYPVSTNNGGQTIETLGAPTRFYAFQDFCRETAAPYIWNLNHEYTHYLDGRYIKKGDFGDFDGHKTNWWAEGLAEYSMYSYLQRPDLKAIAQAPKHTFNLSELFDTQYWNGDSAGNRVYQWGYLAFRYMFEKHKPDIDNLIGYFRVGNYIAADTYLENIGTSYDADFNTWLDQCAGGTCGGPNHAPTAAFTSTVNGLTASFTGTSTDADGQLAQCSWNFGDGTTSTTLAQAPNPTHTYTTPGTYTVTLTVTDSAGATSTVSHPVTVGSPVSTPPTAGFTSSVTGLTAAFTDTSTDADGSIASRSWSFGDGGTSTAASPTHAYTAAGTYTVTLTVTDDKGAIASTSKNVTVTSATTPPTVAECTDSDVRKLGKNCKRSNLSSAAGNLSYFYINIPAGTTQLTITTSGGTGDADLYYKKDTWASTTSYTSKATGPGNSHTLTVTNPPAGDNYITLHAAQAFNGVTLTTQY
ncbi:collagenase [Streptomyces sp. NPDC020800]|uniref:collagenase n=1 Tax=Streptomyces sp. NPDC020800 TaxID=3365092 RepID=UPI00378B591A